MSATVSKNMGIFNAKQFQESFSESSGSNVYFTFGRTVPWQAESNPALPNTSISNHYQIWKNMIGGKKILSVDAHLVVPRFDWVANTVYNHYDDRSDSRTLMSNTNAFYVVTSEWNVYKCISNGVYGTASTIKPTSLSTTSDFGLSDGYVWKYMYTVQPDGILRYTNNEYIPVKTLGVDDNSNQWQVQKNAIPRAISNIIVTNNGSGYSNTSNLTVTITGDGSGATANVSTNTTSNTITTITILNKGIGYTFANAVISGGGGTGAVLRAIIDPPKGHGGDAETELGGSYLMLNPSLDNTEGGVLSVASDYRQVALIQEPTLYGTSNVADVSVFSQLTTFQLDGLSANYSLDEWVYQGADLDTSTYRGVVADWDSTNNKIKLSNVQGSPKSELLIGSVSGAARYANTVYQPDMEPYSGKLLYIDNTIPIERAIDQSEDFKIVLSF